MAREEESCRPRGTPGLWALMVGTQQGLCIPAVPAEGWLMPGQGQCTRGTSVPERDAREWLTSLLLRVGELAGDS